MDSVWRPGSLAVLGPLFSAYTFKHALVQEAAYQTLLKSRRQQIHQRIVHVLTERFPETAEVRPELLAHHCTEPAPLSRRSTTGTARASGPKSARRTSRRSRIS
jgi:hypothetical protein